MFRKYLADNKVELLPFTAEHAVRALDSYMHGKPPFKPAEKRESERKHIPDSWIFEAALEVKVRSGRHCVLVKDDRFQWALQEAGFEVFGEIDDLDQVIDKAELMASTLVASGVLNEISNRLIPTDVSLAEHMATEPVVRALLLRMI